MFHLNPPVMEEMIIKLLAALKITARFVRDSVGPTCPFVLLQMSISEVLSK